jgi:hypothetical protein
MRTALSTCRNWKLCPRLLALDGGRITGKQEVSSLQSGSSSPGKRSAPARVNGRALLSARRHPPRSRRTPSASGRRPWAGVLSSSQSFEMGSLSGKCRLRTATFSSGVPYWENAISIFQLNRNSPWKPWSEIATLVNRGSAHDT